MKQREPDCGRALFASTGNAWIQPVLMLMPQPQKVTFIYTNSHDATADLLVTQIGADRLFRFNFNMWGDYKIQLSDAGFEIHNPVGRRVTLDDVAKFYWRKPLSEKQLDVNASVPARVNYIEEELWYMMREVANHLRSLGRLVLVEPYADARCGKVLQSKLASRYFTVPRYKCVFGSSQWLRPGHRAVVKSLTSTRIDKESVFYTTAVDEGDLDPAVPWMIQELVDAEKDVTVAVVRDKLFAFELDRSSFIGRTLDWREVATEHVTDNWLVHVLPQNIQESIFSLMSDLRLQYGRLDFLLKEGVYSFLEVNPNGEWGWLDAEGEHGLLDKVVSEISPDTPTHPVDPLFTAFGEVSRLR
jgi:hypothetical protein